MAGDVWRALARPMTKKKLIAVVSIVLILVVVITAVVVAGVVVVGIQ